MPNVVVATGVTAILALVFRSRVFGRIDRTNSSWTDAWLKAVTIVVFVVFSTIYLPSWVLQTSTVTGMTRTVQDLIGAGVWVAAMGITFWGLWYLHKERRV